MAGKVEAARGRAVLVGVSEVEDMDAGAPKDVWDGAAILEDGPGAEGGASVRKSRRISVSVPSISFGTVVVEAAT